MPADELKSMTDVRAAIDAVDRELVPLLARRFRAIRRAAEIKQEPEHSLVPWRVEDVADKVRSRAGEVGFDPDIAERIWRAMMDECIEFERRVIAERKTSHG